MVERGSGDWRELGGEGDKGLRREDGKGWTERNGGGEGVGGRIRVGRRGDMNRWDSLEISVRTVLFTHPPRH